MENSLRLGVLQLAHVEIIRVSLWIFSEHQGEFKDVPVESDESGDAFIDAMARDVLGNLGKHDFHSFDPVAESAVIQEKVSVCLDHHAHGTLVGGQGVHGRVVLQVLGHVLDDPG